MDLELAGNVALVTGASRGIMEPEVYAEILALEDAQDYENPCYEELLMRHHYDRACPAHTDGAMAGVRPPQKTVTD